MQSTNLELLATALSKFQSEIRGAKKDSVNTFFKAKFADLESVWEAIRVPLTANGLSVVQTTDYLVDAGTVVVTTILHNSGQWMSGRLPVTAVKSDPQSMGSAITYARRYALAAITGIYQSDDDAESAQPARDTSHHSPSSQEYHGPTSLSGPAGMEGDYVVKFGKHKGKKLSNMATDEIKSYISWLKKEADKSGKPLSGGGADFIEHAETYLQTFGPTNRYEAPPHNELENFPF